MIELKDIKIHAVYTGHLSGVYGLLKGSGAAFYSSGGDGRVLQWELNNPSSAQQIAISSSPVYAIAHHAETDALAIGNMAGELIIRWPDRKLLVLKEKGPTIYALAFDNENQRLLAASDEGIFEAYNINNWKQELSLVNLGSRLRCIEIAEELIYLGGSEGNVFSLNRALLQPVHNFQANQPTVFSILNLKKTSAFFSVGRDAHIRKWQAGSAHFIPSAIKSIAAHMTTINHLIKLENGLLISASKDKEIRIWNTDLDLLKVINAEKFGRHINSVNRLAYIEKENILLSASDDKTIVAWKLSL